MEYGGYVGVSQSEEPEHELSVAMVIYLPTCAKTSWKVAGQKLQPQQLQLRLSKGQVTIWVTFKIKEQKYLGFLLFLFCLKDGLTSSPPPISYRKMRPFWCVSQWLVGSQSVCTSSLLKFFPRNDLMRTMNDLQTFMVYVHGSLHIHRIPDERRKHRWIDKSALCLLSTSLNQQSSFTVKLWPNWDILAAAPRLI